MNKYAPTYFITKSQSHFCNFLDIRFENTHTPANGNENSETLFGESYVQ